MVLARERVKRDAFGPYSSYVAKVLGTDLEALLVIPIIDYGPSVRLFTLIESCVNIMQYY